MHLQPLTRLQVTDGLLLTAERWRQAHHYHRQRQNVHYQSLHQPGIVGGLKVTVIPAPEQFAAQFRDRRWVRIQPGIAIDAIGNPIIVPEPIDYRLASEAPPTGTTMIYLVISYVDPDRLHRSEEPEIVQETFRIDEKTTPPDSLEVELCRIVIQAGEVSLEANPNVFDPGINHLDLRHREFAQARPLGNVRVGLVASEDLPGVNPEPWQALRRSLPALYPSLGTDAIAPLPLHESTEISSYHLLVLATSQLNALADFQLELLKQYLNLGGVLLIQRDSEIHRYAQLAIVRQELHQTLTKLRQTQQLPAEQQELEAELQATEIALAEEIAAIANPIKTFAQQLEIDVSGEGNCDRHHPLRNTPFPFAQFPIIQGIPTHFQTWGGILLQIGSLSQAWTTDASLSLPRETLRSAQEMGINLLHYAWRRREMS